MTDFLMAIAHPYLSAYGAAPPTPPGRYAHIIALRGTTHAGPHWILDSPPTRFPTRGGAGGGWPVEKGSE